eukprot:CAMPEP_0172688604 /NCGR_PEP_ID=MMETSP1074-20121228/22534_1 /TAXON_ID=2916 /ORGANISM="Ceratium fusus, Strain PA161109" /LENGTH=64 /DNA_ID=CAMNT_0013508275 /DNA_START=485 /DNA_END=679 /DNA_ORIENTATION=+
MVVDAVAMGPVVSPGAIVNITIVMAEPALAILTIILPLPLILSPIRPRLHSMSMTVVAKPFTSV